MTCNVALMNTEPFGASKKAVNLFTVVLLETVKVSRDVNHATQPGRCLKYSAGREKLARPSDRRKQDLGWQIVAQGIDHEHAIRPGHSASMHTAQLSKLDIATWHSL
jgi:hypothetical protein